MAQEGVAALGGSVCRALAHTPQAELALQLAVRMALADGFVLIEENTMLLDLARGLGVNEARLEPIIQAELARDERFRSQEEPPE